MDETNSWTNWFQRVSAGVIDKASTAEWVLPYETDRLKLQALGNLGYYTEGQRNAVLGGGALGGVNPGVLLLLGGVVVVALLLKK